ncbi:MAG: V-type ATP synthase subunit I [Oscillibacter sp.]|nr:V-type ATP synthase subunit I [Oscillibacter sp.]
MSIAKMKQIHLIALQRDRDALMAKLLHVGCLEVNEPTAIISDSAWTEFLHREGAQTAQRKAELSELTAAMDALQKYAPQKTKLFSPKPEISEKDFLDEAALRAALENARAINAHLREVTRLTAQETRLQADRLALEPWKTLDLPLDCSGTRTTEILLGTLPTGADFDALKNALSQAVPEAEALLVSENKEQKYMMAFTLKGLTDKVLETLRSFGFAYTQLKDLHGTVQENLDRIAGELKTLGQQREQELQAVRDFGPSQAEGRVCIDRLQQQLSREETVERLMVDDTILYLGGWVPEADVPRLTGVLSEFDCAFDLADPPAEDYPEVPVKLNNNKLTSPLNMVTEMYSLPAYGSLDPNPLMAPFFILFYGIMMADMGYGMLMMIGSLLALKKMKVTGGAHHFAALLGLCGISTFIVGLLTGSFFGDFIPQVAKIVNPNTTLTALPSVFTPLTDTVAILIGALCLGFIQVITGMIISVVKKCRDGQAMDAVFNEVAWWLMIAGVALLVLKIGAGKIVLILGAADLVVGQFVTKKKVGAALGGLLGAVYNGVTGLFSDILSYSRLMALMLSGSIISTVFNTLGAVADNLIVFVIISMLGNALNFALNLLGCYVHDLRLQVLEFFGRFYEDGGRPYRPFAMNTKYVNIIKEEQEND